MKRLIVWLVLLCAVGAVRAWQVDLGLGNSRAQTRNGVWYQDGFDNAKTLSAPAAVLGAQQDLNDTWRVHVDGVWLGGTSVRAAFVPNDANYAPETPTHCRGKCLPLAHLTGDGRVYGLAVTAEAHTQGLLGSLGLEAGPFIYHATWNLTVPDLYPARVNEDGSVAEVGPREPAVAVVSRDQHWRLGGVLGARVQRGHFALSVRRYFDGGGFKGHLNDPWPPIWSHHTVVMVHYLF